MINLIFVHIGKELPTYFWDTIEQTRRFHTGDIYVIIPKKELWNENVKRYKCKSIAYENLLNFEKNLLFEKYSWQKKYGMGNLYFTSTQRLFLIEKTMRDYNLSNVIHLENDVILYTDIKVLEKPLISNFKDKVIVCPLSDQHASASFMYIDNIYSINLFNNLLLECFLKGENWATINIFKFISEMILLLYLHKEHPSLIKTFPILPENKGSDNINIFNSLFDPASWGQYIGGCDPKFRPERGPGFRDKTHWIGQELLEDKYSISWKEDSKGRLCPYVAQGDKSWKLNNLHLHCKEISWYTSNKFLKLNNLYHLYKDFKRYISLFKNKFQRGDLGLKDAKKLIRNVIIK